MDTKHFILALMVLGIIFTLYIISFVVGLITDNQSEICGWYGDGVCMCGCFK